IRRNLGQANLFAFGIGSGVNRHLIEGMAHVGKGEPFIITNPEEAADKAERFRRLIASPMLTQVKLSVNGFDAYDIEPENIPDVLSDRPVIVFGKWRGVAQGTLTVSGLTGEGRFRQDIAVDAVKPSSANDALRYLWARERIALLADYNLLDADEKRIKEVTDLGLRYNLLTAYTSFVAVDSQDHNRGGKQSSVAQPLPLPQGVSDYAVGGGNTVCRAMSLAPTMAKEAASSSRDATKPPAAPRVQKAEAPMRLSIDTITVTPNLSESALRTRVQGILPVLSGCLPHTPAPGTLEIILTIKADGSLRTVNIKSGARIGRAVKHCIERVFKQQRYPTPADGKPTTAHVTITIKKEDGWSRS
ncbi:MAG TPA: trypsin, partial [Deltaproteobacteria bacterium]|nr:trypsin [Deltaproteobacteria bacterium]